MQPEIENQKPSSKVWGGWPTVGFGMAIFAVYFFVQSIIAVIFAVVFTISKYASNPGINLQQLLKSLSTNGLLISIAVIFSAIVGVGLIILFIKIRKGVTIKEYLELHPLSKKTVFVILAVIVGLIIISTYFNSIFGQSSNDAFTLDAYKTSVWPALLGVAVVIFAPAFEESFFRGFLFVGLEKTWLGSTGTIILTAAAWALLHFQYDIFGMATILVLGLIFGIVRWKTRTLWSTVLLHSIWNLAAIVGTALYLHGIGK